MNEYERGFIDGIKSKVSAELTPTLINVSKTMLEMLKPVLSTALENALNDNNAITDTDVQPVKRGRWESSQRTIETGTVYCSNCAIEYYISDLQTVGDCNGIVHYCPNCGARMDGDEECQ